ncbi:hypothetical protein H0X48_05555, partial [Candidatus Dependentiae bacterium]|nr:hypothetical protein [Candidatus Dependentiae bacterium]
EHAQSELVAKASIQALYLTLLANLEWLALEDQALAQLAKLNSATRLAIENQLWIKHKVTLATALCAYFTYHLPPSAPHNRFSEIVDTTTVLGVTEIPQTPLLFDVQVMSRRIGVLGTSKHRTIKCGPFSLEESLLLLYCKGDSLDRGWDYISDDTKQILKTLIKRLDVWMELAVFSV